MTDKQRHTFHDQVAHAVRGWFREPFEDMGYRNEIRPFGVYWSNGMVYPDPAAAGDFAGFMADLRDHYGQDEVLVNLDDRQLENQLGPLLAAAGWPEDASDMFLAHVGPPPDMKPLPELVLEPAGEDNLREFTLTGLIGFGDVESIQDNESLAQVMTRRRDELSGTGRGMLARLRGEPAGVIRWFDDPHDIWILGLAVLPAYRGRGIGSALIKRRLHDEYAAGKRSVLINVALRNDGARRLYSRLGFHDEVYRRRQYLWQPH